jgi:hypothetical protein
MLVKIEFTVSLFFFLVATKNRPAFDRIKRQYDVIIWNRVSLSVCARVHSFGFHNVLALLH